MKPWLVIPAKPFSAAKSRLAGVLSATQRAELSAYLLTRTLQIATAANCFAGVVVVSRDPAALALARQFGALPLLETVPNLNAALSQARAWVEAAGADAMLIAPADLPGVRAEDLRLLVAAFDAEGEVVIAPSRDGGTNALLLALPARFDFAFGRDSYRQHCLSAVEAGCIVRTVCTETLHFDLDAPADWAELTADPATDFWEISSGATHDRPQGISRFLSERPG